MEMGFSNYRILGSGVAKIRVDSVKSLLVVVL